MNEENISIYEVGTKGGSIGRKCVPINVNQVTYDKNIVISRPDKGNGVVILNRDDYICKVNSILDDSSKFTRLDSDTLDVCLKREGKLVRFLRDTLQKRSLSLTRYIVNFSPL